jgi:4-amino-4-deoxy-L-arabinose transferase-like glycosyltransferase
MQPASRLRFLVPLLLAAHAGLLAWGAARHSPSIDEVGHLGAGLGHWKLGRFDLYCVNPPLVRMTAALPVLACRPSFDWPGQPEDFKNRAEFSVGAALITENGERSFWFFTVARWAVIPFSLLGGYVCWRWACELFGAPAGLLALTLWCFCPVVLGHAQMITPDTGAAALGVTAHYLFWRWLKSPGWGCALLAGAGLGLAELTKSTWVFLFVLWPVLWMFWRWPQPDVDGRTLLRQVGQLAAILMAGLFLLNAGYGFSGTLRRLNTYTFRSAALSGRSNPGPPVTNRFGNTLLGEVPVPLPKAYVLGVDLQKKDFEEGYLSYLRGEWRHGGWWYYYLYGLGVKVPLGTWLLALLAVGLALARPDCRAARRDELFLLVPFVAILTLVSSQTGFNHHLRYVLPAFPFAFILVSRVGRLAVAGAAWLRVTAGAALAWSVAASLAVYPHNLSYFNELAGGPANGGKHMLDSNLDWGQDLLFLRDWLREHPEAQPLGLVYFGAFDPRAAGIEFTLPPPGPVQGLDTRTPEAVELGPQPGWYAVSVTILHGYRFGVPNGHGGGKYLNDAYYTYFQRFDPVARAGYSINIYHITPEQAERVRAELGLPPLTPANADGPRDAGRERSGD